MGLRPDWSTGIRANESTRMDSVKWQAMWSLLRWSLYSGKRLFFRGQKKQQIMPATQDYSSVGRLINVRIFHRHVMQVRGTEGAKRCNV